MENLIWGRRLLILPPVMMKDLVKTKNICWLKISLLSLVLIVFSNTLAFSQPDSCVLLLQQAPLNGGTITPGTGVHRLQIDETVILKAVPNPGYQFVYWLGDVVDATSSKTETSVDSPKIIVAVFERVAFDFRVAAKPVHINLGPPRLIPNFGQPGGAGGGGAGGRRRGGGGFEEQPLVIEEEPIPDENDPFPVPDEVPEPATVMLLGLGSMLMLKNKKK